MVGREGTEMNKELKKILSNNGVFVSSQDLNVKLDFDSVKFMEILIDIEYTLDIIIPDDKLMNIDTVANLDELVENELIKNAQYKK